MLYVCFYVYFSAFSNKQSKWPLEKKGFNLNEQLTVSAEDATWFCGDLNINLRIEICYSGATKVNW